MREIEFRGICRDGGFVYGFLSIGIDSFFIEQRHEIPPTMNDPCGDCITTRDEILDVKTIGQYTGLLDKNGKKIFEGDLVEHKMPDTLNFIGKIIYGWIEYVPSVASFRTLDSDGTEEPIHDDIIIEVTGTIHE